MANMKNKLNQTSLLVLEGSAHRIPKTALTKTTGRKHKWEKRGEQEEKQTGGKSKDAEKDGEQPNENENLSRPQEDVLRNEPGM